MEEQIHDVAKDGIDSLVKINSGLEDAKEELRAKAKGIEGFSQRFIAETPKVGSKVLSLPSSSDD